MCPFGFSMFLSSSCFEAESDGWIFSYESNMLQCTAKILSTRRCSDYDFLIFSFHPLIFFLFLRRGCDFSILQNISFFKDN